MHKQTNPLKSFLHSIKKRSEKRDGAEKYTQFNTLNGIDDVRTLILCANGRVGTSFPMSLTVCKCECVSACVSLNKFQVRISPKKEERIWE